MIIFLWCCRLYSLLIYIFPTIFYAWLKRPCIGVLQIHWNPVIFGSYINNFENKRGPIFVLPVLYPMKYLASVSLFFFSCANSLETSIFSISILSRSTAFLEKRNPFFSISTSLNSKYGSRKRYFLIG